MIKFLTENWGAKLISLILAVGLWYYAVGEEGIEVTRTLPLEVKLKHEKLSVVGSPTRVLQVTLQAPRSLLANLTSEEIKAEHQIQKIDSPGDYSFRPEARDIHLPSDQIRVTKIEPEVIQVKIDEVIVQKFEITPDFLGEPAFGYRLTQEEVQMDPAAVLVEGPKSQLEKLEKIKTQPIDLVGRARSFRKMVRLVVGPGLNVITESLVDVYVPIQEVVAERTFENIPVKVLGLPGSASKISLQPDQLNVALRGASKDLEKADLPKITVYFEASELNEGLQEVQPQIFLPPGVFLKEALPPVKVTLQKKGVPS